MYTRLIADCILYICSLLSNRDLSSLFLVDKRMATIVYKALQKRVVERGYKLMNKFEYNNVGFNRFKLLSSDSRIIIMTSQYNFLICNIYNGKIIKNIHFPYHIDNFVVHNNEKRIVTTDSYAGITVYDITKNKILANMSTFEYGLEETIVFGSGKSISSSSNGNLYVCDLYEKKRLYTLRGHSRSINKVAVYDCDTKALSCSDDKTIIAWDLLKKEPIFIFMEHQDLVAGFTIFNADRYVISWGVKDVIYVWDIPNEKLLYKLYTGMERTSNIIVFDLDSKAISIHDKIFIVWDLKNRKIIHKLSYTQFYITDIIVFGSNKRAISYSKKTIVIWDIINGKIMLTIKNDNDITQLALFDSDTKIVAILCGGIIKIWDLAPTLQYNFIKTNGPINRLCNPP